MTVLAAEGPSLVTVPNVPILSTGTYHLMGNLYPQDDTTTFTTDDLAAAVAAVDDPAIKLPRLKLGHVSAWGDAEPAFGKVDNLRLSDDAQTIYGDYVGVPKWLADILPAVYPSRSIEGGAIKTSTGNAHDFVITAVSLLGVMLPGVSTLEDLAGLYTETMPEGVEVDAGTQVTAAIGGDDVKLRGRKVQASINMEDVRRAYYDQLDAEQSWWWIRAVYLDPNELIVDDDNGSLYRVPFTVKGEEVTFDDPAPVKIQYVNAREGDGAPVELEAAEQVYASRSESRPETPEEEDSMDPKKIRETLGLPEDASDEEVYAKLEAVESESSNAPPDPDESGTETETPEEEESETASAPEGEQVPAAASEGTVTVDAEQWSQTQAAARAGAEARQAQLDTERDQLLDKAISAGKLPPSRREHYLRLYAADPEGTKSLIDGLAAGVVPVDQTAQVGESQTAAAYDPNWLSPAEQRRIQAAREETPLVTQEKV